MDLLVYLIVRCMFFFLSLLRHEAAVSLLASVMRTLLIFLPQYRQIAHENLKIAFPEKDENFRNKVISDTCTFLARLLMDFYRLPFLDSKWESNNVIYRDAALKEKISSENKGKGIVFASGHLGSFEVLANSLNLNNFPLNFIVRNFKNPYLDNWWNSRRQLNLQNIYTLPPGSPGRN